MKNITFICSAIISGTSMVAKLCLDNGAWFGDIDHIQGLEYPIYENTRFRQLCRNVLRIDKDLEGEDLSRSFLAFFDSLPEGETIVLKYPKSFYLLEMFKKIIGSGFKVVYVMRNPFLRAESFQKRTQKTLEMYNAALKEWHEAHTILSQKSKELNVYPVLFERFFVEPEMEVKKLLDFIGLEYDTLNLSGIDEKKKHY